MRTEACSWSIKITSRVMPWSAKSKNSSSQFLLGRRAPKVTILGIYIWTCSETLVKAKTSICLWVPNTENMGITVSARVPWTSNIVVPYSETKDFNRRPLIRARKSIKNRSRAFRTSLSAKKLRLSSLKSSSCLACSASCPDRCLKSSLQPLSGPKSCRSSRVASVMINAYSKSS